MADTALKTALADELSKLVSQHRDIVVLCSDSRGSSGFASFASEHPEAFVEVGIAEQNEVGIAAGLAAVGMRPYVAAPAAFLSSRAAEQVKIDVAYSHMNVKLFGVSGGISYGDLGASHYSINDIAVMRSFADLDILIPSDAVQMRAIARHSVTTERGCYIRTGRGPVPIIYSDEESAFTYGKANMLRDGRDATIIAIGEMVSPAMQAADNLKARGISVRLLDMPCIRPLDTEAIERAAEDTGRIITVEEHGCYGGLGSTVMEALSEHPVPIRMIALPDEYCFTGSTADIKAHYGLTAEGIEESVASFIGGME